MLYEKGKTKAQLEFHLGGTVKGKKKKKKRWRLANLSDTNSPKLM